MTKEQRSLLESLAGERTYEGEAARASLAALDSARAEALEEAARYVLTRPAHYGMVFQDMAAQGIRALIHAQPKEEKP